MPRRLTAPWLAVGPATDGLVRNRLGVNLAIATAALLLALLAAELLVRALAAGDPRRDPDPARCAWLAEAAKCRAAVAAGRAFDSRTRLEVLIDLAREGRTAWPGVKPAGVLAWGWRIRVDGRPVVPLAGLSDDLTVYCNEGGEWISYRSDEYGFRNPPGLHARPIDVAILGDSFAQGYCVRDDEQLAARIRSRYPRTLNLGIDGNGPLIALATLREFAAPLAPRRVVWLFHAGSDPDDLDWEKRQPLLRAYLDPAHRHGLREMQEPIDRQIAAHIERERQRGQLRRASLRRLRSRDERPVLDVLLLGEIRDRLRRLLAALERGALAPGRRDDLGRRLPDTGAAERLDVALLRAILTSARDEVRAWGGDLVFVYLPSWSGVVGPAPDPVRAPVRGLVGELGIPWVDAHEVFAAHPDPAALFPFRLPGHYSAEGYRRVADAVLTALAR